MGFEEGPKIEIERNLFTYFNKNTFKSVLFFSGGIVLFITGVIGYGIIINLRTPTLDEAMAMKGLKQISNPHIVISKKQYALFLYSDSVLVKSYRASFGRNVNSSSHFTEELATPVGNYQICSVDTESVYDKFLRLNYPNIEDITDALRKGVITQKQYDKLKYEFYYAECPKTKTAIGGPLGIHGQGRLNFLLKNLPFVYNWTDGSVAVSNEAIDEINSVVKKGTKVVIQ
jgi:murein L,D-transpeptidase YafK